MENFRGRPPGFRNPRRNDDGNWRNPSSGNAEGPYQRRNSSSSQHGNPLRERAGFSGNTNTQRTGPHQDNFGRQRRNRASSTSSEQTYDRRNFSGYRENRNQNPRGNSSNENSRNRRFRQDNANMNQGSENRNSQHSRGHRSMGFKALERLLEKDSEELILELSNSKRGILEYLKTNLSDDAVVLLIKILRKVSDSEFDTKYTVLQTYMDDTFVDSVTKYIAYLPLQDKNQKFKNKYFWQDSDEFWNNIIKICKDLIDFVPTFACRTLPKILGGLKLYIPAFEDTYSRHVSDEIKEDVKGLHEVIQTKIKENEENEKKQLKEKMSREVEEEEPPDDFREISVYPDSSELIANSRSFLRPNVIKGPYKDVNHYLDVQFRLLREDFVGPLRTGIASYRSESNKRVENVRIYKRIRFLNPETVNEHYCIRVRFDFTNHKKSKKSFKYENSRRFMFGSLLCFTLDNFRTFIFGRISERNVEDLEKGELIVAFDEDVTVFYDIDYLMVECNVYFEPYFHVLNVLKNMTVDNFPMERYIVQVDPSIQPPAYLVNSNELIYNVNGYSFNPLQNYWPNRNFYNLNESQLVAFKAALTQEFAIIQGPPGTGKTYLGLKIAKTLLENTKMWYDKTPMLVICYTNHALDQFLEGIKEFTPKILRVGGQSKNEKLKSFNLKNRSRFKMNAAVYQKRDEVQHLLLKIKNISENLKQIDYYHSVRNFSVFEEVIPDFSKSWFQRASKNEILDWLLGGRGQNAMPPQAEIGQVIQAQLNNLNINEESPPSDDEDDASDEEIEVNDTNDDIFEIVNAMNVQCSFPLITLKALYDRIVHLKIRINELRLIETPTVEQLLEEEKSSQELWILEDDYKYLNMRLNQGKWNRSVEEDLIKNVNLKNPNEMHPDDRWKLYFHWLKIYRKKLIEKAELLKRDFRETYKIYEEMRNIEDVNSMKNVLVVGMTTTSAARLRSSLQTLKSPVVIVEEAAEVLEAHIITSLTKHCRHLILIGDHQQLKPSTADYGVERHFKLGISLFERMVINNIQCYTLNVQHRMRPEISCLIKPAIYPFLEDHPSVHQRPAIKGIDKCVYFIDHQHQEVDCEGTSKKNYHEVNFLISLARHLILNGYDPKEITILAAYLGQMFELQKARSKHRDILENVRIAVLDNYQGEECDIILLSLVRNNNENRIGFLSIENRVCVALSRARNGFYIMGNMSQLCSASQIWLKIRATLEEADSLGPKLALRCQIHTEEVTYVENPDDFIAISEGGCSKKCGVNLACGHQCTSLCHILDRDHYNYKCLEKCYKKLCDDEQHICKKMCYEDCGLCCYKVLRNLPCGHEIFLDCHIHWETYQCTVRVLTTLPCGHKAEKPCSYDTATYRCPHPCEYKVEPCGHQCILNCHIRRDPDHLEYKCRKPCAKYREGCTVKTEEHLCTRLCYEECEPCLIRVKKHRTVCPHVYNVPCNSDVDEIDCVKPCTKKLDCGHKCKSKCNESCGRCEVMVEKVHPICKHKIKVKCYQEPDRKLCNKKCPLQLLCGHPCTTKCNEPCTTDCKVVVDCNIKAPCGHIITKIKCSKINLAEPKLLLEYCNHPCREELKCGHKCSGSCGECFQGRVHKICSEKCGVPLVCDHPCEFPCSQACRPCVRPCPYKCQHSACRKRCGEVCTPCRERCPRNCVHQRCTKFCGDICNVPPCEEPCPKMLKCGHPCIGFCGDPCPPKCLTCDKDELLEAFFGFEDEDARYVLLQDCGHVIENTGLEMWLQQNQNEISYKLCPKCKTAIKTTQRYSDYIKRAMEDVAKVKLGTNGTFKENDSKRIELQQQLQKIKLSSAILCLFCPRLKTIQDTIAKRLETSRRGRRQAINKYELNSITSKLQIMEHIIQICCKDNIKIDKLGTNCYSQVQFISKILLREEDYVTDQEIEDINLELNRLSRIIEYSQIKESPNFNYYSSHNAKINPIVNEIEERIYSSRKFLEIVEIDTKRFLEELNKLVSSPIGISENEKREIVRAMGFNRGHWFKCPKGHFYCIGECGGAMQEAVCPECGAKIGGRNHALTAGNAVATEMDGATHSAWSEATNLLNYNIRDLQF